MSLTTTSTAVTHSEFHAGGDPVLVPLGQARDNYLRFQADLEQDNADAEDARATLARIQEIHRELTQELGTAQRRLEQEEKKARRQRERAAHLAAALKDIHGMLAEGNIYQLILKCCLTITGGTRGIY